MHWKKSGGHHVFPRRGKVPEPVGRSRPRIALVSRMREMRRPARSTFMLATGSEIDEYRHYLGANIARTTLIRNAGVPAPRKRPIRRSNRSESFHQGVSSC